MSLFRPDGRERRSLDTLADILAMARGAVTRSGVPVDADSALRHSAVFACTDLISELIATLPVDEYRRVGNAVPVQVPSSPLLVDPAGDGYGLETWLRQILMSLLLRGNAFGLVLQVGTDGWPTQVEIVNPDLVQARRNRTTGPVDGWVLDGTDVAQWPAGPLWHLPAYTLPGSPVGMSPIRYAAETIGLGLSVQKFGAHWFEADSHPSSVLESEQRLDKDQAAAAKARLLEVMKGNREPLVLGNGLKFKPIQVSPNESQFLDTMQANVADVARYFRVPASRINGTTGESMTYATVEGNALDLLTYTIAPWLVRIERGISRLQPRPRYVKFNADALVRVDLATRYRAHDLAVRTGWRSRDEVRYVEDLQPIPDGTGSEYLWPPYSTAPPAPTAPEVEAPQ